MPELPEVETIANSIRPALVRRRILGAQLLWGKTLAAPAAADFDARIQGQQILDVDRRGKFLRLHLSNGALFIHLRMSGDLRVEPESAEVAPHDRLLLALDNGTRLAFNDARKFGRIWLLSNVNDTPAQLGPEPLDPAFTAQDFYQRLQKTHRQLKPLLLDQSFIAGLGNIYVDESLHLARLHPLRNSNTLALEDAERLLSSIRQVLAEGLRRNGASIDWVYRGGDFQNYFRAYQRTGEPCPVCGTPIIRLVIGQRGTHICPNCQRL